DPEPVDAVGLTTRILLKAPAPVGPPVGPPACTCTDWQYISCGVGGCKETEMFMIRTCTPPGCAPEQQCLEIPACIIGDFKFELQESIEIPQGEDRKITGSLTNIGIVPLTIVLSAEAEKNITITSMPTKIDLPLKAEKSIEISVHVPLTTEAKEYSMVVVAKADNITKTKSSRIVVVRSQHILTLRDITKSLEQLEAKITEYERVGIDVKELKELLESAKEKAKIGLKAIDEDDLPLLRKSVGEAEGIIRAIQLRLLALKLRKFLYENKWNILAIVILAIFSNYFVTQVALPYRRLGKEIKRVLEEEKSLVASRVETEKQYFLRKIDEKTFFTLMAEKQGKILRARADASRKIKERKELIISRLHPRAMALWFKSSVIEFAIYLKNLPRLVYEKIKKRKVVEIKLPKVKKPKVKLSRELKYRIWKIKYRILKIFSKAK
ncbi:MAG: hypothetical protein QMD14_04655, partial [Candidatus Aenigmarchaeota archaeon]|nr:hypothetical protein [Candidatus Aenigmarchaeota archaeon]